MTGDAAATDPTSTFRKLETVSFLSAGGLKLVGDVEGPPLGAPVILLHGGGQTRHSWAGAQHRLSREGYRVFNVDQRGHGDSDWAPDGDYAPSTFAADLLAILRTIDRPAALVGASLGGLASFYATGLDTCPKAGVLVMVDIALRPSQQGADRITAFMAAHADGFASLEAAAAAVAAYNPNRVRRPDHRGLRKNLRLRADGRFYWHWDPRILAAGNADTIDMRYEALVRLSANIHIPVLLVRGERSDVITDESVEDLRRHVPQTEVLVVPGAGHMVAGDRNDVFTEGVVAFLKDHHPVAP